MNKKSKLAFELHDDVMHKNIIYSYRHHYDNVRCEYLHSTLRYFYMEMIIKI